MKKPRGTNRLLRSLEKQSTSAELLDITEFLRRQYDYRKLGLGIWHTTATTIPLAVRQQAIRVLLATFFQWNQQLIAQQEEFYLAIWLFEREFAHSSQVVAGIGEKIKAYHQLFTNCDSTLSLPAKYQQLSGADQLDWVACHSNEWYKPEDFINGWPAWMLRRPHHLYTDDTGREFLIVQTDRVWVGTLPICFTLADRP
ncbi:hypothetical protein [Hymenobacter volaticus]|uniref:Uncharacterized protein n=1 Tax=Hymenobacter volaticus TaxID=2932254 RepID=A0ABY4GBM5_9BACT|nr:hypothetical protein [Hymenobacter volaticus]UOQ68165.1 hypothetical protein MUN86_10105 [Hymenobacter volaticus]